MVRPSGLPVTVIVKVPAGVVVAVVIVNVVEHVGLQDADVNPALAPLGRPDTVKLTDCVVPETRVTVIVVEPEAPCTTVIPAEFESE